MTFTKYIENQMFLKQKRELVAKYETIYFIHLQNSKDLMAGY